MRMVLVGLGVVALAMGSAVSAQIAVSANDGKQLGAGKPDDVRTPDSIAILDLSAKAPKLLASIAAPASMIGPPASVAVARDGSFALVSAAQRPGPDGKPVSDDTLSVIDLRAPAKAHVVQTLHAGTIASGVAINRTTTLAAVANGGADTISTFTIAAGRLTPLGTIQLEAGSKPLDLAFSHDGTSLYVVAQGKSKLLHLTVSGRTVALATDAIDLGAQPYSMSLAPTADLAVVTNLGGRAPSAAPGPKMGTIALVDLKAGKVVDMVDAGFTPEAVLFSPDGRFVQATIINGSNAAPTSPAYHDHGSLRVFAVSSATLKPVAEVATGKWCQGGAWTRDGRAIALQCGDAKQINTYRFDGRTLIADPSATLQLDARPGAIATAQSR